MGPYKPSEKFHFFPLFPIFIPIHLLAVLGAILYPLTSSLLVLCLAMTFIPVLGVTMMYHRYHTHQSFKFKHKNLERFFTILGLFSLQKGPIWWSSIHRYHHQSSDTDMDPHDSTKGFWYSHILWLGHLDPRWTWGFLVERFADLAPREVGQDPFYRFLDKAYYFANPLLLIVLYLIGGAPWLFWGGFIALVFNWHFTWLINSASHMSGYRPFKSRDHASNNALVGIVALGEGWHNNHHAFPASANHGFFRWWEFDATFVVVWVLEKLGLVTQVRRVNAAQMESKRIMSPEYKPGSKPEALPS